MCHHEAIQSCDSDCSASAGELIVKIPKDTYDSSGRYGEYMYIMPSVQEVILVRFHFWFYPME